jgi:hypothetical protein
MQNDNGNIIENEEDLDKSEAQNAPVSDLNEEDDPVIEPEVVKVKRNALGQLAKGQVLNPNGRPAGAINMTSKLKNALSIVGEGRHASADLEIVDKVLELAKQGDKAMIQLIWNYVDGKPIQRIDHTSLGEGVQALSDEQMEKLNNTFSKESNETDE